MVERENGTKSQKSGKESGEFKSTDRIGSQVGHFQFGFQDSFGLFDGLLSLADGADQRPLRFRQDTRHLGLLDLVVHHPIDTIQLVIVLLTYWLFIWLIG